jgi:predicted lipoprotein with Yx(FWY)xxD motif
MTASAGHQRNFLTGKQGMTLNTVDKDNNGKLACYGGYAANSPPYVAASSANVSPRSE